MCVGVDQCLWCVDLLECMNGEHKDDVPPQAALKFIYERLLGNLDNWAVTVKILIIFHRGLQNIKVNRKIYKAMKEQSAMMNSYQPKVKDASTNYNIKMYSEISRLYCNYIKVYVVVANKTDILSKAMNSISDDVAQLSAS